MDTKEKLLRLKIDQYKTYIWFLFLMVFGIVIGMSNLNVSSNWMMIVPISIGAIILIYLILEYDSASHKLKKHILRKRRESV
jgi:hypothetical protein